MQKLAKKLTEQKVFLMKSALSLPTVIINKHLYHLLSFDKKLV